MANDTQFLTGITSRFGWILGVMLASVIISFLIRPAMAVTPAPAKTLGFLRDFYFYDYAYKTGLAATIIASIALICFQRLQLRLIFFVELTFALAIVACFYSARNQSTDNLLKDNIEAEQQHRSSMEQAQQP